ncbi:hypothetical protein [Campylobacter majalis]|uniref:hypothetical protein n=1 Tax=Campylobacter majalis TaxID=2790656 RepID=UPI003D68BE6C
MKISMASLANLHGKKLESSFIHTVGDEINQVFLQIGGEWFVVVGKKGGESVEFIPSADPITLDLELRRMPMITQFEGLEISAIEAMGKELEGSGFQINFSEFYDKGLIIQSIYSGTKPENFDDCLRVGVANYIFKV